MSELEEFEKQLDEVRRALEADPQNEELAAARTELEEIIRLTRELEEKEAPPAATKTGQQKRRREGEASAEEAVPQEIPAWMRVRPGDSEKTKAAKRKRIHAIKSKQRLQKLEEESRARASSWQAFAKKKGPRHESIFRSPEGAAGRVGVSGSGRGLTQQSGSNGARERVRTAATTDDDVA